MTDCIASAVVLPNGSAITTSPMPRRVRLFGIDIDPLRMSEAVGRLLDWVDDDDRRCRYVVTPNADHAVLFQEHESLRNAYADAELVLVDGIPVLLAAKLLRRGVPERVTGSDLVPALFDAASRKSCDASVSPALKIDARTTTRQLRVYLLGAAPGVAQRAATKIEERWPAVRIVGCDSPAIGFEKRPEENDAILNRVAAAEADVLIVGLGAPKQELWVHAHRRRIAAPVTLCVGATIDFLAGERRRAPVWMQRIGLEWLHRMMSEPRRLAKRYLRDAAKFPSLVWREWAAGSGGE
jgi:N-acetylglucosaminyldiphosphoundecaprenol N-acetyl-beta-D-mannosaminyltransferase